MHAMRVFSVFLVGIIYTSDASSQSEYKQINVIDYIIVFFAFNIT